MAQPAGVAPSYLCQILSKCALTCIHQWHVSCAIYVAAIWGGSPCASGVAPSMAVASITKLHTPRSRKLHRFNHVRRILSMYLRFLRGKKMAQVRRLYWCELRHVCWPPGGPKYMAQLVYSAPLTFTPKYTIQLLPPAIRKPPCIKVSSESTARSRLISLSWHVLHRWIRMTLYHNLPSKICPVRCILQYIYIIHIHMYFIYICMLL